LLAAEAPDAARGLIGALITRGSGPNARSGRIVEVEAYGGQDDLASHARFGPSKRNAVMFGSAGVAYVYLVYGMYHCLNVVVAAEGRAAAVLIRAVEPVGGVAEMRSSRSAVAVARAAGRGTGAVELARRRIEALPVTRLAAGPGLVCDAFSIEVSQNGRDLCDAAADLRLELDTGTTPLPVDAGPRIGIDYAAEPWLSRPWRFFVAGSRSLSTGSKP